MLTKAIKLKSITFGVYNMIEIGQIYSNVRIKYRAAAFLLLMALLTFSSCTDSKYDRIDVPLGLSAGIQSKQLYIARGEDSGMTSVDEVFIVWELQATTREIEHATSDAQITENLEWHTGQTDRLESALLHFTKCAAFNSFQSHISNIVNDPDVRYAFRTFETNSDGTMGGIQVWVCSPRERKITFLSSE
jgi:hypothetical protein